MFQLIGLWFLRISRNLFLGQFASIKPTIITPMQICWLYEKTFINTGFAINVILGQFCSLVPVLFGEEILHDLHR